MTENPPLKRCSRGDQCVHPMGCWQPATTVYFHSNKTQPDGLHKWCKTCRAEETSRYRERHSKDISTRKRAYRLCNPDKERARHSRYRSKNRERVRDSKQRYYKDHVSDIYAKTRIYRKRNAKKISDYMRTYKQAYREINRDKILMQDHRRRARKRALPDAFTAADWQRALDYFGGCCAVCGRVPDEHVILAADHWIALSDPRPDNPGSVAVNLLPLCHATKGGIGGCNNRKGRRDPVEFLETEFGQRRAEQILARITAYFAWVKAQDAA